MDDRAARRARAAKRAGMVGRIVRPEDDRSPVGATPLERLQMLADVSARAWALSGRPVPTWTRAEMPGRVIRRGRPTGDVDP